MTQEELRTVASKGFGEFLHTLSSLCPSELVSLELYLYRNDGKARAAAVLQAGLVNCGDEYYDY